MSLDANKLSAESCRFIVIQSILKNINLKNNWKIKENDDYTLAYTTGYTTVCIGGWWTCELKSTELVKWIPEAFNKKLRNFLRIFTKII